MNAKRLPVRRVAMVIVGVLTFGVLALSAAQPAAGQPQTAARITPLQGLVQVRADTDPEYEWQTITAEQFLFEGDWVQTDHLGLAEVVFFDGNLVEVLPDSLLKVDEYAFADDDSPTLVLDLSVGDLLNQIDEALDDDSRYEVHTPSAGITVRGTTFFTGVTWQGETILNHKSGKLAIDGILPDGTVGPSTVITTSQSRSISSEGKIGKPGPYTAPEYPPPAPLAPETCGNAICEPGEIDVCALDCLTSATCGNGICEPEALEGPATCRVDCVPARLGQSTSEADDSAPPPDDTGLPCTISATTSGVIIRVGPGFERGRRLYLTPNIGVPVVGKFTDSAGNLWWNIQPPDYIPTEADRYWVLAADVITAGDCALVPDVAAPPVIAPLPPFPPPQPPSYPPAVSIPTATPVPTPAPTDEPTDVVPSVSFYADRYTVSRIRGECATLYWTVIGSRYVVYQDVRVPTHGSDTQCPGKTQAFSLIVTWPDGSQEYFLVIITVER